MSLVCHHGMGWFQQSIGGDQGLVAQLFVVWIQECGHTCVNWDDCTMLKKVGGLSLPSSEDDMKTIVSKWIVQALLPDHSNLQTLLRYCITQLQPSYKGFRDPSSL